MKGGFRRPFIGMASALIGAMGGMPQGGIPAIEQPKLARKGKERKRTNSSTSQDKHGARERERRMRQSPKHNYIHGLQYLPYREMLGCCWPQSCKCGLPPNHWKGKF